jgi:hypothetical protein
MDGCPTFCLTHYMKLSYSGFILNFAGGSWQLTSLIVGPTVLSTESEWGCSSGTEDVLVSNFYQSVHSMGRRNPAGCTTKTAFVLLFPVR